MRLLDCSIRNGGQGGMTTYCGNWDNGTGGTGGTGIVKITYV